MFVDRSCAAPRQHQRGQVKTVTMCPRTAQRKVATENTQTREKIPSSANPQREPLSCAMPQRREHPNCATCKERHSELGNSAKNPQLHMSLNTYVCFHPETFLFWVYSGKTLKIIPQACQTYHRERRPHSLGCPWSCEPASSSRSHDTFPSRLQRRMLSFVPGRGRSENRFPRTTLSNLRQRCSLVYKACNRRDVRRSKSVCTACRHLTVVKQGTTPTQNWARRANGHRLHPYIGSTEYNGH